jgi:transposase-like protein
VGLVRPVAPNPEVVEKPVRRRFSAAYKLAVLREADGCREPGEIGALLRREGLYSSHLAAWRRQRETGLLAGLSPHKRGRKAKEHNPLQRRLAQLERDKARLTQRLQQAELIIEFQKKVSEILGIPLGSKETSEDES